jgi:hypothetical protein
MVLANSGSMAGTKLVNLRTAAHGLVDILFGSAAESPNVKIALVPYTAVVNVGTDKIGSGWLDQTGYRRFKAEISICRLDTRCSV